jgi:hypothetical protein
VAFIRCLTMPECRRTPRAPCTRHTHAMQAENLASQSLYLQRTVLTGILVSAAFLGHHLRHMYSLSSRVTTQETGTRTLEQAQETGFNSGYNIRPTVGSASMLTKSRKCRTERQGGRDRRYSGKTTFDVSNSISAGGLTVMMNPPALSGLLLDVTCKLASSCQNHEQQLQCGVLGISSPASWQNKHYGRRETIYTYFERRKEF